MAKLEFLDICAHTCSTISSPYNKITLMHKFVKSIVNFFTFPSLFSEMYVKDVQSGMTEKDGEPVILKVQYEHIKSCTGQQN